MAIRVRRLLAEVEDDSPGQTITLTDASTGSVLGSGAAQAGAWDFPVAAGGALIQVPFSVLLAGTAAGVGAADGSIGVAAPGGAVSGGPAAGHAGGSGTLGSAQPIPDGTAGGAAGASATLGVQGSMTATAGGAAGASANMRVSQPLGGSAGGSSTAGPATEQTMRYMAAAATAAAGASGTLARTNRLTAAAGGQAGGSGTLSGVIPGTDVAAGNISGTWTTAGSPYRINGNVVIPKGSTLTIQPGVSIEFQGQYSFSVRGSCQAVWDGTNRIKFTTKTSDRIVAEGGTKTVSTWVGWLGVRIDGAEYTLTQIDHGAGVFRFEGCDFDYVDKSSGASGHPWKEYLGSFYGHGYYASDLILNDCRVHHQRSDAFALYPGSYDFGATDVYYYRNEVYGSDSNGVQTDLGSAFDIAHCQQPAGTNARVHFVGGGAYDITNANTSPKVCYSFDATVWLDSITISNCGASGGWFFAQEAGASINIGTLLAGAAAGAGATSSPTVSQSGPSLVTRSDNFNRSNSTGLGANWAAPVGMTLPNIASNMASSPSGLRSAYWSADTFGADQFSELGASIQASGYGPTVRQQSGSDSCYVAWLEYDIGNDDGTFLAYVGRVSSGSIYTLNYVEGISPGTVRVEAQGTTIRLKVNGTEIVSATDATYSGGAPGIRVQSGSAVDNWSGGDL